MFEPTENRKIPHPSILIIKKKGLSWKIPTLHAINDIYGFKMSAVGVYDGHLKSLIWSKYHSDDFYTALQQTIHYQQTLFQ